MMSSLFSALFTMNGGLVMRKLSTCAVKSFPVSLHFNKNLWLLMRCCTTWGPDHRGVNLLLWCVGFTAFRYTVFPGFMSLVVEFLCCRSSMPSLASCKYLFARSLILIAFIYLFLVYSPRFSISTFLPSSI